MLGQLFLRGWEGTVLSKNKPADFSISCVRTVHVQAVCPIRTLVFGLWILCFG